MSNSFSKRVTTCGWWSLCWWHQIWEYNANQRWYHAKITPALNPLAIS